MRLGCNISFSAIMYLYVAYRTGDYCGEAGALIGD